MIQDKGKKEDYKGFKNYISDWKRGKIILSKFPSKTPMDIYYNKISKPTKHSHAGSRSFCNNISLSFFLP